MQKQSGASLIMVFFIMTIMLSVVLGLGTILFNELKNIKSTEKSLVSFYTADTGIEKTLYYNRKMLPLSPVGVLNGICNICDSCDDCQECQSIGEDCNFCRSCRVSYFTTFENRRFETLAIISPNGIYYNLDISVVGFYGDTSRAIGLQIANKDLSSSVPIIQNELAERSEGVVRISADITDLDGIDAPTVIAHIRNSNDPNVPDITTVWLEKTEESGPNAYVGRENLGNGYYFVYIRACDLLGNCGESTKFPVTDQ